MKTADLTDAQLDYWVGRAENIRRKKDYSPYIYEREVEIRAHSRGEVCWQNIDYKWQKYRPSTDWKFGRVIVERELIELVVIYRDDGTFDAWGAYAEGTHHDGAPEAIGEKPLIAAMRAYVTKVFGDEVPVE